MNPSEKQHITVLPDDYHFFRFSWFQLMRPLTFTGTISPILAGTAFAALKGNVRLDLLFFLLAASILIQAAANMLNDYFDFCNGQDQDRWQTKQHTGPAHHHIPTVALFLIGVAAMLGIWLASESNWIIIPIGMIGIAVGFFYSAGKYSLSALGLGELTAAIYLGVIPTLLAYIIQGNSIDTGIFAVALPYALLIALMILSNNIRDIQKDADFRSTLAIKLGRKKAAYLHATMLLFTYVTVFLLIATQLIHWTAVSVILAAPFSWRLYSAYRLDATRSMEIAGMKWSALHHWVFGLLLSIGIWIGG